MIQAAVVSSGSWRVLRMARSQVQGVFVILIAWTLAVGWTQDADDITTIYRLSEIDERIRELKKVGSLGEWKISSGFIWTYNSMMDVPFPGEGYVSLKAAEGSISDVLAINTENTFAVSSSSSVINIYLMTNESPQFGNLIAVRLSGNEVEILTCNGGETGMNITLPGIGTRRCRQYMKNEPASNFYNFNGDGGMLTLHFKEDRTVAFDNGLTHYLPSNFHEMKYICMVSHGNVSFRKPARVLALTEPSSYLSYRVTPGDQDLSCFSLYYYMDQKCEGEISLYRKEENSTLLGRISGLHQMGSWKIHRFVIPWTHVTDDDRGVYLEIHAKKNFNAPLLIHSVQNCEKTDQWDSTTFSMWGSVDIHARTNALGRPLVLHNGSAVDPNVEIDIPSCRNHEENCEWILNNWSRVKDYTQEMDTAPLLLWRERTSSLTTADGQWSESLSFSGNMDFNFTTENAGYDSKQLRVYIHDRTQFPREFKLLIIIKEDEMRLLEQGHHNTPDNYWDIYRAKCLIPRYDDVWCRSICNVNTRFRFENGNTYRFSMETTGDQIKVVVEGQAAGNLECSGSYSITLPETYYLSLYPEHLMTQVSIVKKANYMLGLDQEEGNITSPLILPTTDQLCVSLLHYLKGGILTLDAEFMNGTRVQLGKLSDKYVPATVDGYPTTQPSSFDIQDSVQYTKSEGWTYSRIVKELGRQPLRLILQGTAGESGKVLVQRIAGCHPEEDIVELGQKNNLQVISPVLVNSSEQSPLVTGFCKNGGLLKEAKCVCPPGFTGTQCERACGSDRFGNDCNGRCSHSSRECKGMMLCKQIWGCSCAPGYKGIFCSQDCEDGKYGADCRQTCGKCATSGCDRFTGTCLEGCQEGYHPPMCQDKCSYFTRAPEVQRTGGKISIVLSHDIMGNGLPLYYQIQYKEEVYSPWLTMYSAAPMKDVASYGVVNITEPSSKENYFIRAVIINEDGCSYQGETVPFVELKNNCKFPDHKVYHLASRDIGEHNFTLFWQPPANNGEWCEVSHYEVFIKEGWKWILYGTTNSSSLNINQRSPGESYQVKLRAVTFLGNVSGFSESVEVKTNELSVAAVQNFKVTTSDSTQLLLQWEYPYPAKHFLLTYQCVKLLGCPNESCEHSKGHYQCHDTSATLRDLLPLARYTVKITAFADTFGPSSTLQALTLPAGYEATPTEVEEAVKDCTNTSFTVQWAPPSNCSKLNGFQQGYWYRFRLAGEGTTLLDGSTIQTSASFTNLTPHTQYEVDVFVVTNSGWDEKYPLTISASTRASTPERVANLTVYKRGRREIGLRWAPPAQTYGELQSFAISCMETSMPTKPISTVISPTPCSAWPDFYCFTVRKLRPGLEYSLSVQARNVEVSEDGDSTSVLAKTQEGAPTTPSYIQVIRTDSTSIKIKWGIPWLLNGILRSFLVSVEEVDSFNSSDCCQYFPTREMPVNTEESYYQLEVASLRPASTYTISVSAKTMGFGPAMNLTAHTKPPVPTIPSEPLVILDDNDEGDEIRVQLTPVPQFQDLVRGYLLLLVPEDPQDIPEATIWDSVLAQDIKTAVNQSFYIVGEYSQDQLTGDGVVNFLDEKRHQSIGILSELSQFSMNSDNSYKVIIVAVLEYEGAYSFSFKESNAFTAPVSFR